MTHRRDRRKQLRRIAVRVASNYSCPDCLAHTSLGEPFPGVFKVLVAHDPTCPSYQSMSEETAT